jgi:polo-like kinase 1
LLIGKPPFETSDVKTTYRRIRMNAYQFPDHVQISDAARDMITKILNNDPAKRPNLDELLAHEFICHGGSIPRLLPASTLACPPSKTYINQFLSTNTTGRDRPLTEQPKLKVTNDPINDPTGEKTNPPTPKGPDVWVKKWVDYSSKYGLGYLLSNRATGVFFNDSTKIILDPAGHFFDYYERRTTDKKDVGKEHTLTDYPKELQKKVTLL